MNASLPSIKISDLGEERTIFTLPPASRPELDSVLAFAVPKSGSVMLDNVMKSLSAHTGLTWVSVMAEFFLLGLPGEKAPAETEKIFLPKGYCYGGFRYLPRQYRIPILGKVKTILLVRDPRDMLVSYYYSMQKSHPDMGRALKSSQSELPHRKLSQRMNIDDFVLETKGSFKFWLRDYVELCNRVEIRIYRYEDLIYRKREWVQDLATFFGWKIDPIVASEIAARNDIFPTTENDSVHVRQVHPGNFKTKLKPETVAALNDSFAEEMSYFGYSPELSKARESPEDRR